MIPAERRGLLLTRLHQDGILIARDLAIELGLSEDSVRRDLRELAAAGLCQRVYGGALPVSPGKGEFAMRLGIATESKRRVAARAAQLIAPGSTVILGSGTSAHAVAGELPQNLNAMIITPSPVTAAALVNHPTVDVFVLGGCLQKRSASVCGAASADAASKISADIYLLGVGGIHVDEGLTTGDPEQAALERILVGRAADTYVLGFTEKLGTVTAFSVVGLSAVAGVITDADSTHPTVRELRKRKVPVIHAP